MWDQHLAGEIIGLRTGRSGLKAERPTLLMIHGSGGRAENFLPQLQGLDGEINVAALSLPGHGETAGTSRDTVDGYAQWLGGFLARGPVRPVLLGHSLGGAIAQTMAIDHPHLLRGLVLLGTGARLRVLDAILKGIVDNFPDTVKLITRYAYGEKADPGLLAQGERQMLEVPPQVLLDDFGACNKFDVMERLKRIKLPTLVLVGDQDQLTPVKYSQFLANGIAGAELRVIAGGGHMVQLEQPQALNQAILEFMAHR